MGFISPHSHYFCSAGNKIRVMADGKLVLWSQARQVNQLINA
ncbi:hypothetical protein HGO40_12895 [Pseudomonas sp. CG7]|nr:hypothetical protein [Pseudomonas sp. CG7]